MLHIEHLAVNMMSENTFIVSDETKEAVIIDCGTFDPEEKKTISDYVAKEKLTIRHLLQTHCHFDHILGAPFVAKTWDVLPEMHSKEVNLYHSLPQQLKMFLGMELPVVLPPVGGTFEWGDTFTFGNHTIQTLPCPGHTPGGTCFYLKDEGVLFSGDSLFHECIGRTDFPGGDQRLLLKSLWEHILTLPDDVVVAPGHGDTTTIGHEKKNNLYLFL